MRRSVRALAALAAGALAAASLPGAAAPQEGPPPPAGAALEALAQPPRHSAFASQRIYFVLPDRYANGDPANDRGGASGDRSRTGFDPADPGFYHGGDLKGLTGTCATGGGLARIASLGFTALWIAPVVRQQWVQGDSASYHGYWGLDFTTVDPHLGTEAEFAALVDCAHRLGLKVYLDVVVNHTADVVRLAGGTRFRGSEEAPYRDCRGRPFAPERYAGGRRFPCLSARYQPRRPLLPAAGRRAKRPVWLNEVVRYHNRGDIDFSSCSAYCLEHGDFFGLDDLFTEQPFVVDGLARVYGEWVRRYRLDGFRVDTAKHVDRAFFRAWTPKIRAAARAAGVSELEVFGEVTLSDAAELAAFARARGLPNVLDFPLQDALVRYAGGSAGARGVAARLDDDDYFRRSDGLAPAPATFLGNHDLGRAAALIREQAGASGLELQRRVVLGYELLFLLRGAPVVYYGDEMGMMGRGGDKAARQDMFPTGVAEWRAEERVGSPPIGAGSSLALDAAAHPVGGALLRVARLRERYPALAVGGTAVREARRGLLVLSRVDAEERREYLVAVNAGEEAQPVAVGTATPSARWAQVLGEGVGPVESDAEGRVAFAVRPLDVVVLRAEAELPRRGPLRARLRAGGDRFTGLRVLSASLGSPDPASVAFALRRNGGRWARLAVDDTPPYRAFLDPRRFRRGERVHAVAVVRASDGSVSVSPPVALVVRR